MISLSISSLLLIPYSKEYEDASMHMECLRNKSYLFLDWMYSTVDNKYKQAMLSPHIIVLHDLREAMTNSLEEMV